MNYSSSVFHGKIVGFSDLVVVFVPIFVFQMVFCAKIKQNL